MRVAVLELVFMLVVLKIPVVYLCLVVWWAIRAEPRPLEGAARPAELPDPPHDRWHRRAPRRGPRRGPSRPSVRRATARRVRLEP